LARNSPTHSVYYATYPFDLFGYHQYRCKSGCVHQVSVWKRPTRFQTMMWFCAVCHARMNEHQNCIIELPTLNACYMRCRVCQNENNDICLTSMKPVALCCAQRRRATVAQYWSVCQILGALSLHDVRPLMAFMLESVDQCCAVVNGVSLQLLFIES
jgi:hypothetical protein